MSFNPHKKPSHPVDIHVGKRLRLRRKTLGLSQADLGRQVGVTFQQIQKYERGTNRMGASRLWEFAQALQIPINYFFDSYRKEEDNTKHNFLESNLLESREAQLLVCAYYEIPNQKLRKTIVSLIRAIADNAT